ncbi:hypothetical protein D3C72_866360 [compost metagenome]
MTVTILPLALGNVCVPVNIVCNTGAIMVNENRANTVDNKLQMKYTSSLPLSLRT